MITNEILAILEHVLPPPSYQCGGTGWTPVALIDMTNTNQQCPSGLNLTSYSKRTCGRTTSAAGACNSTSFSVGGMTYSWACGRIIGYQFGIGAAFLGYNCGISTTIDSPYVGSVSLTHGAPGARQHIWTFATGNTEVDQSGVAKYLCPCSHIWTFATGITEVDQSGVAKYLCPCSTTENVTVLPFVGNDYWYVSVTLMIISMKTLHWNS